MGEAKRHFQFVPISHPDEAVAWQTQVRSHVARTPRNRRKKTAVAQDKARKTRAVQVRNGTLRPTSATGTLSRPPASGLIPTLGYSRLSSVDCFPRILSDQEKFLLEYCKFSRPAPADTSPVTIRHREPFVNPTADLVQL